MRDLYIMKVIKEKSVFSQCTLMCAAAGLPGSGGWRRPHSPRHMGECVHDASAGEWYPDELTQMTSHDASCQREPQIILVGGGGGDAEFNYVI